jgi:glycosyltransferase involved in cell wall biosynthesis
MTRIALVLWSGLIGGAETFSVALARELREKGIGVSVAFVSGSEPLAESLRACEIPYENLGLSRGRAVLRRPRLIARTIGRLGPDGSLLIEPGLLAAALRVGGYRAPIVAVNHGAVIHRESLSIPAAIKQRSREFAGFWAADVEVAVSDAVLEAVRRHLHARRLIRIYNGVDLDSFKPRSDNRTNETLTIGWAGRLIRGKGVEDLIASFARVQRSRRAILRIAGDGPLRGRLERLAASEGVSHRVRFERTVDDMPSFWRTCDLAAMPSNEWIESFGMAAAEAMASGIPVVAARAGGLPEVVQDGHTGLLHEPGDIIALAGALDRYAEDAELRLAHGLNARRVCEERFDIRDCASRYRALFEGET